MMRKYIQYSLYVILSVYFATFSLSGSAQSNPAKNQWPPQEALDACKGKSEQDNCSFMAPNKKSLEGKCLKPPKQNEFICIPKPPPQAFEACKDKKEGDACTITGLNKKFTFKGVCGMGPMSEGKLICKHAPSAQDQKSTK